MRMAVRLTGLLFFASPPGALSLFISSSYILSWLTYSRPALGQISEGLEAPSGGTGLHWTALRHSSAIAEGPSKPP
jgi:hypothetical protein